MYVQRNSGPVMEVEPPQATAIKVTMFILGLLAFAAAVLGAVMWMQSPVMGTITPKSLLSGAGSLALLEIVLATVLYTQKPSRGVPLPSLQLQNKPQQPQSEEFTEDRIQKVKEFLAVSSTKKGRDNQLYRILCDHPDFLDVSDEKGQTLLHIFCAEYPLPEQYIHAIATWNEGKGIKLLETQDENGRTPFHNLAQTKDDIFLGVFDYLVTQLRNHHGEAKMQSVLALQDQDGNTALHLAFQANKVENAKRLMDKMDIKDWNLANNAGKTLNDYLFE